MVGWLLLALCACAWARAEPTRARALRFGHPIALENVVAPTVVTYILDAFKGLGDQCEVRVSHVALPPVTFSFALGEFPDDGSVELDRRRPLKAAHRRRALRNRTGTTRRRRLDTSTFQVPLGKRGRIVVDGKELERALLYVSVRPAGVRSYGVEPTVAVAYNIVVEMNMLNNAVPESGVRMAFVGALCLLGAALVLVPALSRLLARGDELAVEVMMIVKEN